MLPERPKAGWGILEPDEEITEETKEILRRMESLPRGQVDALLARANGRFLEVVMNCQEPSESDMVLCTGHLSNIWLDILGKP